jgi:DNA ligase-1
LIAGSLTAVHWIEGFWTEDNMARREFLQLAKTYKPGKDKIGGWYLSEKLDGTRCFWDAGVSRGLPTESVPWASVTDPKTGARKGKIKPVATGLWSRYGNPIIAPDEFLDLLPCVPLDGELWAGRGNFQLCRSICGGDSPDVRFSQIEFAVYGTPSLFRVFATGEIKNANMVANFDADKIGEWLDKRSAKIEFLSMDPDCVFDQELMALRTHLDDDRVYMHQQIRLPEAEDAAREQVEIELNKVIERGGEGVMLRDPFSEWTPKRVAGLLKYKPFEDDHGTLVGFTSGRETNKGSKFLGKIGALILNYNGKRLELSGLTDEEREFAQAAMKEFAIANPGQDMPKHFQGAHFKLGQKIGFKYRELSDDGVPKEGRFFRHLDDEE